MLDRHDQEVTRVDRRDIHERDAQVIPIHHTGWGTTGDNFAEDASFHVFFGDSYDGSLTPAFTSGRDMIAPAAVWCNAC